MTGPRTLVAAAVSVAVLVMVAGAGIYWWLGSAPFAAGGPSEVVACQVPSICNESAAVAAAMQEFPAGHLGHGGVARLMTLERALAWSNSSTTADRVDKPVWLVAVLADDLHVSDYAPPGGTSPESDSLISGVWSVWDASGGGLHAMGGLATTDGGPAARQLTYESILALESDTLSVATATPNGSMSSTPSVAYP